MITNVTLTERSDDPRQNASSSSISQLKTDSAEAPGPRQVILLGRIPIRPIQTTCPQAAATRLRNRIDRTPYADAWIGRIWDRPPGFQREARDAPVACAFASWISS